MVYLSSIRKIFIKYWHQLLSKSYWYKYQFRYLSLLSLSIFISFIDFLTFYKHHWALVFIFLIPSFFLILFFIYLLAYPTPEVKIYIPKTILHLNLNNPSQYDVIYIYFEGFHNNFTSDIYNKKIAMFIRDNDINIIDNEKLNKMLINIGIIYAGGSYKRTLLWYPEIFILTLLVPEIFSRLPFLFFLFIICLFILIYKFIKLHKINMETLMFFRIIKKYSPTKRNNFFLNKKFELLFEDFKKGNHFKNIIYSFKMFFPI